MNKKLKPLLLDFDFESKSVLKSLPSAHAALAFNAGIIITSRDNISVVKTLAELKGIASTYYRPFFQSILFKSVKNLARNVMQSCSHAVMQSCSHAVMQSDLISDTNQHYLSLLV